jgi:hypothetical protein
MHLPPALFVPPVLAYAGEQSKNPDSDSPGLTLRASASQHEFCQKYFLEFLIVAALLMQFLKLATNCHSVTVILITGRERDAC